MVTHASCAAEVLCAGDTLYYEHNGPDTIGLKDPEDAMILGLVVLGITTGWCFSNAQGTIGHIVPYLGCTHSRHVF